MAKLGNVLWTGLLLVLGGSDGSNSLDSTEAVAIKVSLGPLKGWQHAEHVDAMFLAPAGLRCASRSGFGSEFHANLSEISHEAVAERHL